MQLTRVEQVQAGFNCMLKSGCTCSILREHKSVRYSRDFVATNRKDLSNKSSVIWNKKKWVSIRSL